MGCNNSTAAGGAVPRRQSSAATTELSEEEKAIMREWEGAAAAKQKAELAALEVQMQVGTGCEPTFRHLVLVPFTRQLFSSPVTT